MIVFAATAGVAGVLVSSGYADGGRQKILDRFQRLGTNVITISPLQSRAVGGRARTGTIVQTLTDSDYKAIKAEVDDIDASSATVTGAFRMRAGDLTKTVAVIGCEPDFFRIKHWTAIAGDTFNRNDVVRQSRVVLLGYGVAKQLFGADDPTGRHLTINRVPFTVAGVMAERGQSLDAANEDDQIYVPLSAATHRLMNADYFGSIVLELEGGAHLAESAANINALLHRRHTRLSPQADDFQVQDQKSVVDAQLAAFARLSFLIGWIAASALAVSALGILGISWIGLRNRIREIGARRAIGATRADVLTQFLTEFLSGCLLGCLLGLITAYVGLLWLDRLVEQPFIFQPLAAMLTSLAALSLFATFVTLASGRAAFVDPMAALRAE